MTVIRTGRLPFPPKDLRSGPASSERICAMAALLSSLWVKLIRWMLPGSGTLGSVGLGRIAGH